MALFDSLIELHGEKAWNYPGYIRKEPNFETRKPERVATTNLAIHMNMRPIFSLTHSTSHSYSLFLCRRAIVYYPFP